MAAVRAERTRNLVRRSDPEKYVLDIVRSGDSGFGQAGRQAVLGAGDLVLLDSSQPFQAWHRSGGHEALRPGTPCGDAESLGLFDTALELLAALLAHELGSPHALPPESRQRSLVAPAHSFIDQHLGDPGLTPQTVADAHHVSLRRLQQVLAAADLSHAALVRRAAPARRTQVGPGAEGSLG
ncbi:hypothetical protein [Streptomyces sp. NRRL B-1347]|uniref:hypothetical protein n=1 Tax=Streptomyces sp. NRRL B-1347 TaxID=1476877 RepID=UPI0004C8982B|nr:hypothetical protein [Streptomyces sp. NRRL B-1347]